MTTFITDENKRYTISSIYYKNKQAFCIIRDNKKNGTFEISPGDLVKTRADILKSMHIADVVKIASLATRSASIVLFPEKSYQFKYFPFLLILFGAALLTANVAAIKLVSVFGITFTGGFLIYPLTFLLGSTIVEVYGYKNARQAIWAGFILNFFFILFINIVAFLPSSAYGNANQIFNEVLVPERRIMIASLISFLFDDFINVYVIAKLKISYCGEFLFKRLSISSISSIAIGTTIFILLAFYNTIPDEILIKLIVAACAKKIACQFILFPFAAFLIKRLKRTEDLDIYDHNTKFNPFSLDVSYHSENFQFVNQEMEITHLSHPRKAKI